MWGVPPWEFERAVEEGKVGFDDVMEAMMLECFSSGLGTDLEGYFHREWKRDRKRVQEEVLGLVRRYEVMADGAEREALGRRINELNGVK